MKFLYPPIFPFLLAQGFGDNNVCYRIVDGKTEVITKGQNTQCPIGYQSMYSQMKGHNGLDMTASHGVPVFAAHDGYIVEIQTEEPRGLGIGIITDKPYYCEETGKFEYFKTRYWHLMAFGVSKGQYVKRGDYIGLADNTGYSSGDHVHFEVKPVSFPSNIDITLVQDADLTNILQDNGYFGAINPITYLIRPIIENVQLSYGQENSNVNALQTMLKYLGFFPKEQTITGYYGNITKDSVFKFQKAYLKLSWIEEYVLKGRTVGPKTLALFQQIIG